QLAQARERLNINGTNVSFIEASATGTGLPPESFDLVYCRFPRPELLGFHRLVPLADHLPEQAASPGKEGPRRLELDSGLVLQQGPRPVLAGPHVCRRASSRSGECCRYGPGFHPTTLAYGARGRGPGRCRAVPNVRKNRLTKQPQVPARNGRAT